MKSRAAMASSGRVTGLNRRQQVPSLLKTVGGKSTTKPVKEVDVDAPPLSDSDEDDDEGAGDDRSSRKFDSSDEVEPQRADIAPTVFAKRGDSKPANTYSRSQTVASNKPAERPTRKSERQIPKGKKSLRRKGPQGHEDDIEDSESDDRRATKRVRTTKGAEKIGDHINGDPFAKTSRRTTKKTYGSRSLDVSSRLNIPDSPESPKKTLKLARETSTEASPEKRTLVLPKRAATREESISPLRTFSLKYPKDEESDSASRPKRKGQRHHASKRGEEAIPEEEESQRPVFKLPETYSYLGGGNGADVSERNVSINHDLTSDHSSPLSSPAESQGPISTSPLCPMCNEPVDPEMLKSFSKSSRMTINQQTRFCRMHKKRSAQELWASRGYPTIQWDVLESRIAESDEYLRSLIEGKSSHFGELLSDKIRAGKSRTLFRSEESLTPGYYGLRGLRAMTEIIVERFSSLLRQRAPKDRLISARGHTGYVQSVLVPELTVRLIEKDMSVGCDEARAILENSRSVGELLNDDKGDQVLRTHDSTDEEAEEDEIAPVNEIDEDSED